MSATKKVLVIDDDPVVGTSFDRVLSGKGYAVISASNGDEALERLAREDYDVVYTDIKMPGMSGLEVARRIKASRPWLPVVIVTGYGTEDNEMEAIELGASGFLRKPLSPEVIEGSLDRAVIAAEAAAAAVKTAATPTAVEPVAEPAGAWQFAKNIGLFFIAPFVALAYVVFGPFIGLGMVAYFGLKRLFSAEKSGT